MRLLKKWLWIISCLILIITFVIYAAKFTMNYFSTAIKAYTDSLIVSYANKIIDEGVSEKVIKLLDGKSVLCESYDSTGKVTYAYLDVNTLNLVRSNVSKYLVDCVNEINDGKTFETIELPLGYFFGLNYFFSKSIKVPIDLEVVGNQEVDIEKNIESYGLNTTVLQINLAISLNIRSVIPFQNNIIETKINIPIALEILNNDIPYYLGIKD